MSDALIGELRALLTEVVGKDAEGVQPGDDLVEKLGIDSLTGLRFLAVIEKKYDLRFPDHQLAEMRSLGKVSEFIAESRQGEGA